VGEYAHYVAGSAHHRGQRPGRRSRECRAVSISPGHQCGWNETLMWQTPRTISSARECLSNTATRMPVVLYSPTPGRTHTDLNCCPRKPKANGVFLGSWPGSNSGATADNLAAGNYSGPICSCDGLYPLPASPHGTVTNWWNNHGYQPIYFRLD